MSNKLISRLGGALLMGLLANTAAIAEKETATAEQAKESHGTDSFDRPPPAPAAQTGAPATASASEQVADEQVEKAIDGTSFDAPPPPSANAAAKGTAHEEPEAQAKKSIDGADF